MPTWRPPTATKLSTQTVTAEIETRNVIRVPEKSATVEDWTAKYLPIVSAPAKEGIH
jgi:hypothetical protein